MLDPCKLFYKLDDDYNVLPATFDEFALSIEEMDKRVVARTKVNGCTVSTVFFGVDASLYSGRPVVFETMIFTHRKGSFKRLRHRLVRYCTYDDAKNGHDDIVRAIKHKNLTRLSDVLGYV